MKRLLIPVLFLSIGLLLQAIVPPHPLYSGDIPFEQNSVSERFDLSKRSDEDPLPETILALLIEFPDKQFIQEEQYPDYLVHDYNYFKRLMLHVSDYWHDASHGNYELYENIHLYEENVMMPNNYGYYGNDATNDERMVEYFDDIIALTDNEIDFSLYDGIITIFAGSGQESDIDGIRTDEIWSTFLSRKDLREINDPENEEYPGLLTNDGVYLNELAVVAESEFQDYFPTEGVDASNYLFSNFGVVLHQFGKLLGLPTLFDNVSSNGRSQGIGNYGIMGSGSWNGNGFIPAMPSAWSRYYLGWENTIELTVDQENIYIDQMLDVDATNPKLYKVAISDTEYFLIECRSQNPDGDFYNGIAGFSFELIEDQEYYPPNPDNPDAPLQPRFMFMENRYRGCDWDIAMPGLGGPAVGGAFQDNSGIFIWHIDELVINEFFSPDYEVNHVNAIATHKGVDLEEADGVQNLDTAAINENMYGGPFDSFRANNNDYFGFNSVDGVISQPTAESYYGGVPLEIYDISQQGNTMSFSVKFRWSLSTSYTGENTLPASSFDYDDDGVNEIFYPMPDGSLYMWQDDELYSGFPSGGTSQLKELYTVDEEYGRVLLPYGENIVSLFNLEHASSDSGYVFSENFRSWAGPPVVTPNEYILAFNHTDGTGSSIVFLNKDFTIKETVTLEDSIRTNICWSNEKTFALTNINDGVGIVTISVYNGEYLTNEFVSEVEPDDEVLALFHTSINENKIEDRFVVQCSDKVYHFGQSDFEHPTLIGYELPERYSPIELPYKTNGLLSFGDMDKNGTLDIIAGWENGVAVFGYNGQLLNQGKDIVTMPDTLGINGSALPIDVDSDGELEIVGNCSLNRLYVWEDNFGIKKGYPKNYSDRSRTYPFLHKDEDGNVYIMSAVDNGKIFRSAIGNSEINVSDFWYAEYGNLQRTASYTGLESQNSYPDSKIFVEDEVYVYPNPYRSTYGDELFVKIMVSETTKVKIKVFDIAGNCIYQDKITCQAYMSNIDKVKLDTDKISSGAYFILLEAENKVKTLKFAIEK